MARKADRHIYSTSEFLDLGIEGMVAELNAYYKHTQQQIRRATKQGYDMSVFPHLQEMDLSKRPTMKRAEREISNIMAEKHISRERATEVLRTRLLLNYHRVHQATDAGKVTAAHIDALKDDKAHFEQVLFGPKSDRELSWEQYRALKGAAEYSTVRSNALYKTWLYGVQAGYYKYDVNDRDMFFQRYKVTDIETVLNRINKFIEESGRVYDTSILMKKFDDVGLSTESLIANSQWNAPEVIGQMERQGRRKYNK